MNKEQRTAKQRTKVKKSTITDYIVITIVVVVVVFLLRCNATRSYHDKAVCPSHA